MITKISVTIDNDSSAYDDRMAPEAFESELEKIKAAMVKDLSEEYPHADIEVDSARINQSKIYLTSDLGEVDAMNEESDESFNVQRILEHVYEKWCEEEI